MTVIQLPDEQAARLAGIAAAQGLSLEEWLKKLAAEAPLPQQFNRARSAAQRIREIRERSKPDPEGWTVRDYVNHGRP
jgi:hypothetical protein